MTDARGIAVFWQQSNALSEPLRYLFCSRYCPGVIPYVFLKSRIKCSGLTFRYLWDDAQQLFVSGAQKQVSYASQVWMVLAGVVDAQAGGELLDRVIALNPEKGMVSPYMNHHFTEALLMCGRKEKALEYIKYYWGGMIRLGADTFWELYNPQNPAESPYGSSIVNSYCHAWSCTPAYLLRKYF